MQRKRVRRYIENILMLYKCQTIKLLHSFCMNSQRNKNYTVFAQLPAHGAARRGAAHTLPLWMGSQCEAPLWSESPPPNPPTNENDFFSSNKNRKSGNFQQLCCNFWGEVEGGWFHLCCTQLDWMPVGTPSVDQRAVDLTSVVARPHSSAAGSQ